MAPHHWFVQPVVGLYISSGVGYCFIRYKAMREAPSKDKAISYHNFFLFATLWELDSTAFTTHMGKITNEAIRIKLLHEIRDNWRKLEWQIPNLDMIQDFEKVEPILSTDFRYEGSGEEYKFSANVYFMVKEPNNAFGVNRKSYRIFPDCKMSIEETGDDFKVKIIEPIHLLKLQ